MSERLNIEQLYATKLEGMEQTPSPSVWKKTARVVRIKQFFRFHAGRFNIYYAAGIALVGAAMIYLITTELAKQDAELRNSRDQEKLYESKKTITVQPQEKDPEQELNQIADSTDSFKKNLNNTEKSEKNIAENESKIQIHVNTLPQDNMLNELKTIDNESDKKVTVPVSTLVPYFTPSVHEGCAPLTVTFVNSTVNATSFSWDFGNSEKVDDKNTPVVTYNTPGTYTVTLTAMGPNGIQKTHSQTITVQPKPVASFEVEQGSIYNYSVDASEFSWYVIPEKELKEDMELSDPYSTAFQPSLSEVVALEKVIHDQASYLLLVARNAFGCSDTVALPLPENSSPELLFPTAFSPNPNGSIGGYYNPNDPGNQVFHPKFDEIPETYHLRIFNKAGKLVFETQNINIGWDGYYQEAPAPRGVYIYQCTGTWKNGTPFQYRGDITIFWNDQ